jgi:hypothetical protein
VSRRVWHICWRLAFNEKLASTGKKEGAANRHTCKKDSHPNPGVQFNDECLDLEHAFLECDLVDLHLLPIVRLHDFLHVSIGGGRGFLRTLAVLTRAQVRRVPIPPMMLAVRFLVGAMMLLSFPQNFCQS